MSYVTQMRDASRAILLGYLEQTHWNVRQAARLAGQNRSHFYKLMSKAGITRPADCCTPGSHRGNSLWQALA